MHQGQVAWKERKVVAATGQQTAISDETDEYGVYQRVKKMLLAIALKGHVRSSTLAVHSVLFPGAVRLSSYYLVYIRAASPLSFPFAPEWPLCIGQPKL